MNGFVRVKTYTTPDVDENGDPLPLKKEDNTLVSVEEAYYQNGQHEGIYRVMYADKVV